MPGEEESPRCEARLEGRALASGSTRPPRVFTWRNRFRRPPRVAEQPGCPLRVLQPRHYSHASLGSRIETTLRFEHQNSSDRTIHSYFWRHASPVKNANGGFGCQPDGGLSPGACQREAAHLTWRGPQTITIDFVQFTDGSVWFSSDPQSLVTQAGLDAGKRAAADHILRVWREGGKAGLAAALPVIHRDVQSHFASFRPGAGLSSFYAGVTSATVLMSVVSDEDVEETLLNLQFAGAE